MTGLVLEVLTALVSYCFVIFGKTLEIVQFSPASSVSDVSLISSSSISVLIADPISI